MSLFLPISLITSFKIFFLQYSINSQAIPGLESGAFVVQLVSGVGFVIVHAKLRGEPQSN